MCVLLFYRCGGFPETKNQGIKINKRVEYIGYMCSDIKDVSFAENLYVSYVQQSVVNNKTIEN